MLLVSTILIGIAFVTISVKQTKRSSKMGHGDAPIGPLLKTYGFWNLFLYAVLLFHFLIYMSNSYKVMGLTYIKDDSLLTLASSIGSLISVAGRLTWPIITEFVQFKYFALTQVVLSSAICFLFPFSFSSPTFYFILCISGSLVNSSYYSVLLIHCGNVYGAELGPSVYSYISTTLVITTISVTLIRYLIPVVGYPVICYIIGSIAASAGVFALRASSVKYSGVQKKISEKLL